MISQPLKSLAEEVGILCQWLDAHGTPVVLDEQVLRGVLHALDLPADNAAQIDASLARVRQHNQDAEHGPLIIADAGQPIDLHGRIAAGSECQLQRQDGSQTRVQVDQLGCLPAQPWGYHQLSCGEQHWQLACAPSACLSVSELTGNSHIWGIAAQVYSLRRPGDAGLGDTLALQHLLDSAVEQGADALAISPLHAMFSSRADQYSPYSPSSRSHFNILHAAPSQVLGEELVQQAMHSSGLSELAQRLEQQPLIDWPAAADLRLRLLRQLHQQLAELPLVLRQDFQRFRDQRAEQLQLHCCHEALQRHLLGSGESADWRHWSTPWQDPDSMQVRQFAEQHAAELEFHAFGQWLAERSLEQVQQRARHAGMGIGLIADMAIGADPSGSFGWANQAQLLPGVSIGAPPDLLNQTGQNWGVAAFSPWGLRQQGYSAFINMLRANLAYSGGLRIDHIMGLQRLWIIPNDAEPDRGAYLNYPLDDLLRLLALESWQHRALIIGEDLGTVPPGLQKVLADCNILGMRVLQFEQQAGELPPPQRWSDQALATTSTHDLPTTLGWLTGQDIDWRQRAGHIPAQQSIEDQQQREQQIGVLDAALRQQKLLADNDDQARLHACIRFLGRTPAPLVLLPLEDVMASSQQPNLPGPGDQHPNWRRRWPEHAAEMLNQPLPRQRLRALDDERRAHDRNRHHD